MYMYDLTHGILKHLLNENMNKVLTFFKQNTSIFRCFCKLNFDELAKKTAKIFVQKRTIFKL